MSPGARVPTYLSIAIKEGKLKLLRHFIPESLFFDTNLPYIKIYERREEGKEKRKLLEFEHPEIALSYLVPGRVTYRYDPYGHLIPARGRVRNGYLYTVLSTSNVVTGRCFSIEKDKVMEELLYALSRSVKPLPNVPFCELEEALLEKFRGWDDPREFGFFGYSSSGRCMYNLEGLIKRELVRRALQVSHRTIAYPRLGSAWNTCAQDNPIESTYVQGLDLRLASMDILRYVYAEDLRVHARLLKREGEFLKESDLRSKVGRWVTPIKEVRLLCFKRSGREDRERPSVIGYQIRETKGLRLQVRPSRLSVLKELLEETKGWLKVKDPSKPEVFTAMSVCQAIRNAITYIITEDLHLKSLWSTRHPKISLDTLMQVALLLYETSSGRDLCSAFLEEGGEALRALRDTLDSLLRDVKRGTSREDKDKKKSFNSKLLTILAVVGGGEDLLRRAASLSERDIDDFVVEVVERINLFGRSPTRAGRSSPDEVALNLLSLVLAHTYAHHILKHVSLRSGALGEFLKEGLQLLESPGGNVVGYELVLFENVAGGIGAFDTAFEYWESSEGSSKLDRLEELLLKLGECSIGSSEDLLYYAEETIPVHITPQEREELKKLEKSFRGEVDRFARIWGVDGNKLATEIIELVRECDKRFSRFTDIDELMICFLERFDPWSALGRLFTEVLAKCLRTSPESARDMLIDIQSGLVGYREIEEDKIKELRRVVSLLKSILVRLTPRSCNTACPSCYYNQRICTYGNPSAQRLLLNRRLLKLVAAKTIRRLGTRVSQDLLGRLTGEPGILVKIGTDLYWVKHGAEAP